MKLKHYSLELDVIRSLAIFLVIVQHVFETISSSDQIIGLTTFFVASTIYVLSHFAVPFFTIISGFIFLNTQKKVGSLPAFYRSRFLRVGIPFIVGIIAYFLWKRYFFGIHFSAYDIYFSVFYSNIGHLYYLAVICGLYFITPALRKFNSFTTKKQHLFFFFIVTCIVLSIKLASFSYGVFEELSSIFLYFLQFMPYYYAGFLLGGLCSGLR